MQVHAKSEWTFQIKWATDYEEDVSFLRMFIFQKHFAIEPQLFKYCFSLNLDEGNATSLSMATLNEASNKVSETSSSSLLDK